MPNNEGETHGDQFDPERFEQGQFGEEAIIHALSDVFDARNVVAVEPDEAFDSYEQNKEIHQVIDFTGIDYLVDTFTNPLFGVNHRNHFNPKASKFDIRVDTGSQHPSEFHKLQAAEQFDIVPKYATRMKIPNEQSVEWFRIVDLHKFITELNDGLYRDFSWTGQGVTAWMYDYDKLRDRGCVVEEFTYE